MPKHVINLVNDLADKESATSPMRSDAPCMNPDSKMSDSERRDLIVLTNMSNMYAHPNEARAFVESAGELTPTVGAIRGGPSTVNADPTGSFVSDIVQVRAMEANSATASDKSGAAWFQSHHSKVAIAKAAITWEEVTAKDEAGIIASAEDKPSIEEVDEETLLFRKSQRFSWNKEEDKFVLNPDFIPPTYDMPPDDEAQPQGEPSCASSPRPEGGQSKKDHVERYVNLD